MYVGDGARDAFAPLVQRVGALGIPVVDLEEGVLETVGTTRTPQPVFAVAEHVTGPIDALGRDELVLVAVGSVIRATPAR